MPHAEGSSRGVDPWNGMPQYPGHGVHEGDGPRGRTHALAVGGRRHPGREDLERELVTRRWAAHFDSDQQVSMRVRGHPSG